jgi:hypothetical protein
MKKIVLGAILLFALFSIIMIILDEDKKDLVNYFTLKQNFSRIISEGENFDVSVFIDSDESFLTDRESITSARIVSEMTELSVDIEKIEKVDDNLLFEEKLYNLYVFSLEFSDVSLNDIDLEFLNSELEVSYVNGDEIEFYLGNIWLSFKNIEVNNHFDISHMYAITDYVTDERVITALVLKFDKYVDQTITISDINSMNKVFGLDLENSYKSLDRINTPLEVNEILGSFDYFGDKSEGLINIEEGYYFIIPFRYYQTAEKLFRFPLEIHYQYQGDEYSFLIDDYLFFDEMIRLDDYHDDAVKYQYSYQESN